MSHVRQPTTAKQYSLDLRMKSVPPILRVTLLPLAQQNDWLCLLRKPSFVRQCNLTCNGILPHPRRRVAMFLPLCRPPSSNYHLIIRSHLNHYQTLITQTQTYKNHSVFTYEFIKKNNSLRPNSRFAEHRLLFVQWLSARIFLPKLAQKQPN